MKTKLILIRHGETDWNRKRKYSGLADVKLNKTGIMQVKKLAKRIKKEPIDKVYCSDRMRAIQTARIVFKKTKLHKVSGLREINFGIFEGLTYEQLMKKYPRIYKKWLKDPYQVKIPGGESLAKLEKRVWRNIKSIAAQNKNKTIAIVMHGGSISILINHILRTKRFWKYVPSSASISIIEFSPKPELITFNDTKHL